MDQPVRALQNIPEIKLVGRKLGPFSEGEEATLKPWEASLLVERGMVEPVHDFSLTGLRKLLIREEKSSQLEDLPSHFYLTISCKVRRLRRKGREEKADRMRETFDSLIGLRVQKLAKMIISSVSPSDIPPEEAILVNRLSRTLRFWRNKLESYFKKSSNEEVGAHERRIRRSIQGIVRDAADIQE